jgi:starvation-inducible DNA-binding protein
MTQMLETRPTGELASTARPLQDTLVELIDLSLQAKQAHWNLVGPTFQQLHELLDVLTDQYRVWSDDVAERMTAAGVAPDGRSATVGSVTPLSQLPVGQVEDRAVLAHFDDAVSLVVDRLRGRVEQLGETDLVSQGVLLEVAAGIEKQRWMIRAHRA